MKKGLMPVLRFPEFRGVGAWRTTKLIDVADKNVKWSFIGGPFGSNLKSSDYTPEGVRVIQLQNIGDAEFKDDYKIFTSEEKANELLSNNIYPGDIILSKMGDPVGRACLIPATHSRYLMCSDGIRIVVDKNEFSKYFIYILINSDWFRASVEASATGSTRKRIGLDVLKKLPFVVPEKIEEQEKIADCLASLDELIAAHTKKHKELQSYKKGLLQNLFPAEGKTVPALRFQEFENTGGWSIKPMKKLFKVGNGKDHKHLASGDIPVYGSGGYMRSVDDYLYDGESACIGRKGTIDRPIFLSGKFWTVDTLFYTHSFVGCIPKFIYLLFQNIDWRSQNEAGGVPSLSKTNIEKIEVAVPNLEEQRKISDCIFSVDDLMAVQEENIKKLKSHKKGLMQKLFPSVDEVGA